MRSGRVLHVTEMSRRSDLLRAEPFGSSFLSARLPKADLSAASYGNDQMHLSRIDLRWLVISLSIAARSSALDNVELPLLYAGAAHRRK